MNRKKLILNGGLGAALISLSLCGCATIKKEPPAAVISEKEVVTKPKVVKERSIAKEEAKPGIRDDVLAFHDLQLIDLNGDGRVEIVAIYINNLHLGAVKVIKIEDDARGAILFKGTFSSPKIRFQVIRGVPSIIVKDKDYPFGFGLSKVYQWDGKSL